MRKELLLAVLVGISLGLLITFGVYRSRQSADRAQDNQTQDLVTSQVTNDSSQDNSQLSITSPEDESIVDKEQIIVSGTTGANNFVVVFLNDSELITNADQSGNFSVEVELDEGPNLIVVEAINEDGQTCKQERVVTVDSDFLEIDFKQLETEVSSDSAQTSEKETDES